MLPWLILHWDASHFIFMGVFYSCLGIIGAGLSFVMAKSIYDYLKGGH